MTSEEAFEKWWDFNGHKEDQREAWQAALEWAAKGQEPVAWLGYDPVVRKHFVSQADWCAEMSDAKPLYLHPAPIQDGWKRVPIEPTEEMLNAACDCQEADPVDGYESEIFYAYKAMLDAAPEYKEEK